MQVTAQNVLWGPQKEIEIQLSLITQTNEDIVHYSIIISFIWFVDDVVETVPTKLYSTESPRVALVGQEVRLKCFFAG